MVNNEIVIRYTAPGRYDVAPYGTICKVIGDGDSSELFVQLSEDLDAPSWMTMAKMFEGVFSRFIDKQDFVSRCSLVLKRCDASEHLLVISEIINKHS